MRADPLPEREILDHLYDDASNDPDEREHRKRNDHPTVPHDRSFPLAGQWTLGLATSVNALAHSAQYMTDSRETPQAGQQACPHWMQPSSSKAYTKGLPQRHRCSMGTNPPHPSRASSMPARAARKCTMSGRISRALGPGRKDVPDRPARLTRGAL
jgi:hypothetical protein